MNGQVMKRLALALLCASGLLLIVTVAAQDEPLFHVIPNNNLNLRACGSTDCAVVDQIQAGIRLPVYAVEGDWYQVRSKGRFLWLAGWLTTRVTVTPTRTATRTPRPTQTPPMPVKFLETEEVWYDSNTGCNIGVTMRPGTRELAVALVGESRRETQVAVFLPGENAPLPTQGLFEDRIVATGVTYLIQHYSTVIRWPTGLYRFRVSVGSATSVFEWEMKRASEFSFFEVYCGDAAFGPRAGRGPVPTPRPAGARGLTPDKILSAAEYYLDPRTGCEIRVSDKGSDGDLNFVLTGDRREVVGVNVFRPEENSPLRISGWNRKTFREDGEPFIWQHYGINTPWRDGLYRLVITLDDRTTVLAWRLERGGDQVIYVRCSGPVPPLTLTPRSQSVADAIIRTDSSELHVDPKTGCGVGVGGFGSFSHFGDVFFDFWGDRQKDVKARIYRPGEDFPLRVHERFSVDVISNIQHYSLNTVWPDGLYRLEIELDGEILRLDWRKEHAAPLQILVICDSQQSHFSEKHLASLTPRPTVTPRPAPSGALYPTPVAEAFIQTGRKYVDSKTGCGIAVEVVSVEQGLEFLLSGDRQAEVVVNVYQPNESYPLQVQGRFGGTFNAGEPYQVQYYSTGIRWPLELYRFEISLDGETSYFDWHMEQDGYHAVLVHCDRAGLSMPTDAPGPTDAGSAVHTPGPTPGEAITSTQTNVCSSITALQADLHRFWSDLREANHPHSAIDPGSHIRFSASVQRQRLRDNLPIGWPIESTTARDFEHLIDSGSLDYPSPGFYTSNIYAFYMITARVAPDMEVLLAGLSRSPVGGTSYPVLTPNEQRCRPTVESQLHYLLERDTSTFPAELFDMCFADFFETYMHYRFNMTENATETTRAIARGFAEVARAAVMMDTSIESLVEDCS